MFMFKILEDPLTEQWNFVLNNSSEKSFWQSLIYGEALKTAYPHTKVFRLLAVDGVTPIGIVQGTYSKYFGIGTNLEIHNGPLIIDEYNDIKTNKEFLLNIEDVCKKKKIVKSQIWWPDNLGMHEIFYELGYKKIERYNMYMIDLGKKSNELWKSMASNKRKNVRKAIKKDLKIVMTQKCEDLQIFYDMLKKSAIRQHFVINPLLWFETILKNGERDKSSMIFLAKLEEKNLAGVFIAVHEKIVYALAAGSIPEGWNVRPNDLLHWRVMEWGCEHNFNKYYMGLVSDPPPKKGSSAWGIWRWKREWKGKFEGVTLFEKYYLSRYKYVIFIKKIVESLYNVIKKLRFLK